MTEMIFDASFLPLKISSSLQEASQIVWQKSTWWPEACLNFGGVGCHSQVVTPYQVKCKKRKGDVVI